MMKKICLLVLMIVLGKMWGYSQGYPLTQNLGSDSTIVVSKGALQSRLIPIVIVDTNSANAQRLKNYPGAQLYTTNGDFYIRNSTATKWVLLSSGSSGSVNIYTADGTLTGNRTLTGANNNLTFGGLNKFTVTTGDTTLFNTNTFGIKGVGGVLNVEGTAAGTTSSLTLKTASDGNWTISTGVAGLELGDLRFYDNDNGGGSARMIIKSTGKVGIGTETPDSMLSVAQGAYFGRGIRAPNLPSALGTKALRIDAQGRISVADTTLGGGTVIQVNTNDGSGITGGPITVSGTLAIDTTNVIATKLSVAGGLAGKLNISDTANMLKNYVNQVGYALTKVNQVVSADSATLSNYYLRRKDSLTATNSLGYVTKTVLADTAAAIRGADAGGTVTSVATNNGTGITGGTITTSGTLAIDTTVISTRAWRQKGVDSIVNNFVPYTGATSTVNLNTQGLYAGNTFFDNVRSEQTFQVKQTSSTSILSGYTTFSSSSSTPSFSFNYGDGVRFAKFNFSNGDYIYDLPSSSGTLALLSDITSAVLGTTNYIPKFTSSFSIGNSNLINNASDNLGLGVAPSSWLSFFRALQIGNTNSSAFLYGRTDASLETGWGVNAYYSSTSPTDWVYTNSGPASYLAQISGGYRFYTAASGTAGNVISWTQAMTLNASGNLGIGDSNPDSMLTVYSGTHLQRGVRMSGLPSAPGTKALRINASGTISIADTLVDAGGTVTSVATNNGTGITGGTITTSGTLAIDTTVISTRAWRQKGIDSVAALINSNVSGTTNYISKFTGANTLGNSIIFENASPPSIGIGTTIPAFTLDVNGSGRFVSALTAASFNGSGSNIFTVSGNEVMRLTNTSATNLGLGIGTTSPDSMLTVTQGTYLQRGVRLSGLPSGIGTKELRIDANGVVYANDTLSNDISGSGTTNYIPKFTGTSAIGNSVIYEASGNVGIGTTSPTAFTGYTSVAADGTSGGAFVTMANGTSALRVISSTTDAAIWEPRNSPILFGVNNAEQMRLTSTGLGIGTSSPGYSLDIYKSGGNLRIYNTANPSALATYSKDLGAIITSYYSASGSPFTRTMDIVSNADAGAESQIRFLTATTASNPTERMRLDASGNLGLGVTPSAWGSVGNTRAMQFSTRSSIYEAYVGTAIANNTYFDGTSDKYIVSDFASIFLQLNGQHRWYTAPSGTAGNTISFTQAMTLDASGRLGIGTTSPTSLLHINTSGSAVGGVRLTSSTNTNGSAYVATNAGGDSYFGRNSSTGGAFGGAAYATVLYGGGAYPMSFYTNDTERMRITSGGNVLVGTTTDNGNKFQVSGTANATQFNSTSGTVSVAPSTNTTFFTPSGAGLYMAHVYLDGNATQTWDATIIFAYNATNILVVNQTNSVNVSTQISGTDIQVRQIGGTTYTFNYEVIRIK